MKKKLVALFVIISLVVPLLPVVLGPSVVLATSGAVVANITTTTAGGGEAYQRKNFYANGRWWVFYSDGTDMYYNSSSDGTTWDDAVLIKAGIPISHFFSVHYDGVFCHYVTAMFAPNYPLNYRMGTPSINGTITWTTAEQTILAADAAKEYRKPVVITDADDYPWVACDYVTGGQIYAYVMESTTKNGTWTMAGTSPHSLANDNGCKATSLIPVASDTIYAFYVSVQKKLYFRAWDGATWSAPETVGAYEMASEAAYSAILNDDVVDVVWIQSAPPYTTRYLQFRERDIGGTWGNVTTLETAGSNLYNPTLSLIDEVGNVVVFLSNVPTSGSLFYRFRIGGEWDADPTEWIVDTCSYPHSTIISNYFGGSYIVGVQYVSSGGSPYTIKFATLNILLPTVTTVEASNVAMTTARLNSVVDSDAGQPVTIRFGWGETSEATIPAYDNYDTVDGVFTEGQHPYLDIEGLSADTLYYFRVEGSNVYGGDLGAELTFTTSADLSGGVQNFRGIPGANSTSLSWDLLTGATSYLIRYKFGSYPTSTTDGTQAYSGSSTSTIHTGLATGTTYYYAIWGKSGASYSDPTTLMLTTSASGGEAGGTLPPIPEPSRWMAAPDYERMAGLGYFYDGVNGTADALEIPRETLWFLGFMGLVGVLSLLLYLKIKGSRGAGTVTLVLLTILLFFGWILGIVPLWIPTIITLALIGLSVSHREVIQG